MTDYRSTYNNLISPSFAGSLDRAGERQAGRRRVLQAGAAASVVGGLAYLGWASATRTAFASNPSANGYGHASSELVTSSYDFGGQGLMQIASGTEFPELYEFRDTGESDTLGIAIAQGNEIAPQLMPLPLPRPDVSSVQLAAANVPLPAVRRTNAIPTAQAIPERSAPPSVAQAVIASNETSASRPDQGSSRRLEELLGRRSRTLRVYAINTGERLSLRYFRNGRYDTGALADLDHLFRDRHSGKVAEIDPGVYDQLFAVSAMFQDREINMLSGYRAPETNEAMRRRMAGVAKFSYHVRAQAADFYITGVPISEIHINSLKLSVGGVGYYPSSNFVHVDTGPLRNWPSRYHGMGVRYRET